MVFPMKDVLDVDLPPICVPFTLGGLAFRLLPPTLRHIYRRQVWLLGGMTIRKLLNLLQVTFSYLTKSDYVLGIPPILKIDISPICTLQCPSCIHANPQGRNLPLLDAQRFRKHDRMSVESFSLIIDQIKARSFAVSLFYYGDPYAHPDADRLCGIARRANLNVHLTTHFSYAFSDARIESIARSGLTHLTIAVDGATQETYGKTRVGGDLKLVLANLKRLTKYKRDHGLRLPFVEVQHLTHSHHPQGEADRVRSIVSEFGVDQFTVRPGAHLTSAGDLVNVVRSDVGEFPVVMPHRPKLFPRCLYPYLSTVIRYNGDVIPCCIHRGARQHIESVDERGMIGNIFRDGMAGIWNSTRYRENRRLVSNPLDLYKHPELKESFCYGCERVTHRIRPQR
jgi:MoaA/NifB/PqqE/SkfB family radical SAM enzyme